MIFFDTLFGNTRQKVYFSSLIKEGKLAHAYILEAPAGSGKKTFSLCLAAAIAAAFPSDSEEETAKKCQRILSGTSPDVMMLKREEGKKTIGVDAVRDFMSTVYLTPSELSFKMYIFDEADIITQQAQNALLKIIEEPPHGVYILLLCKNSLSLLSTVRSRAQKISLQIFDDKELLSYAKKEGLIGGEDEKLQFALRMSGGSIGNLRRLLDGEQAEFAAYTVAKKVVEGQVSKERGVSYFEFLKTISDFAVTREAFDSFLGYLLTAYADIARARCAEDTTSTFFEKEELDRLAMIFATGAVTKSFEIVNAMKDDMRFNVNLSLSAATLGMALWNAVS